MRMEKTPLSLVGSFSIPPDHPCLPGHFPGQPLVPGALLLDRALDLIAAHEPGRTLAGPITVKFLLSVAPGEEVAIHHAPSRLGGRVFEGRIGARLAFTGRAGAAP